MYFIFYALLWPNYFENGFLQEEQLFLFSDTQSVFKLSSFAASYGHASGSNYTFKYLGTLFLRMIVSRVDCDYFITRLQIGKLSVSAYHYGGMCTPFYSQGSL